MDMIKPDFQQIRRDKFRVEQMNDFPNTWTQQQHQNIRIPNNLDLIGILQNQISVPVQTDLYQDSAATFMNMPQSIHRDPQGPSNWRISDLSQPSTVNHGYDQAGIRPNNVADLLSDHFSSRNQILDRPLYVGRDSIPQSSMIRRSEVSCLDDNQKGCVTVACSGTGNEILRSSYDQGSSSGSYRGEFSFLPSLENQSVAHNASNWNHGPVNVTATSHTNNKKGFPLSLLSDIPPSRDVGNAAVLSTMNIHGPLGPFTGYASILKSSRFLEPAQKMLEEFCISYASKIISRRESTSMEDDDDDDDNLSGFSSSSEPLEPKNRLKKAKLLFLQEEVCKWYKLYNHQLQTVMSSFNTVAGLNTATPYISLALKRTSRSFKALRTAIAEHVKQISSHSSNGNNNNRFQKRQRSLIGNNVGFESQQQHIWRPQRGLPERAVAVLRAWLFDHFLHPYPTDSDKQMLATQTGLSRNQVSNWFINARVRLWKPMVEEIHTLETKAIKNADTSHNIEPSNRPNTVSSPSHEQTLTGLSGTKRSRLEYMDMVGFNRGNVSLTLELRRGVDNVIQTQTQDHQFGTGSQMFHDFVG
ncbi:Homeobox-like domain superfamily [Arabidopsis suecica]|uniref:Homeobox-like domain superfamily n=1 Tax=Arabidopsis suecica TaxID=45249 RepID=A0A8T2G2U8_ARASU|nr:Homeobox-like domain superfamily [Arabidopsis suecica]